MRYRCSTWGWAIGLVVLCFQGNAKAQSGDPEYDKILAERAFEAAEALMNDGNYTEAWEKFEESNHYVPGLKTEAALVECLVKLGQYADAHERMVTAAKKVPPGPNQQAEIDWAKKEAEKIQAAAPCITIDVLEAERKIVDLEIDLDGQSVPRDSWNKDCRVVNLGKHFVKIRASHRAWTPQTLTTFTPGKQHTIRINPAHRVEPIAPPLPPPNPVSLWSFLGPTLIFGAVGGILWASNDPDYQSASRIVLGGAAGSFATGAFIYALNIPSSPTAPLRPGPTGVGIGVQGRF